MTKSTAAIREMDLELRKLEFEERVREREIALKEKEFGRAKWSQPLTLAIMAAFLAATGNIVSSNFSSYNQARLEESKSQRQLKADIRRSREQFFLDILKTGDDAKTRSNLQFFLDLEVLTEEDFPNLKTVLAEVASGVRLTPGLPATESALTGPSCDLSLGATASQIAEFEAASVAAGTDKWVKIALGQVGTCETVGPDSNPSILEYFGKAGFPEVTSESTPWVAAFMNWVMIESGFEGTGSLAARSFLTWGAQTDTPVVGSIAVLWTRDPNSQTGFVGLYMGEADNENIWLLGGNLGNAVQVTKHSKTRVLGYRMPL